MNRKNILSVLIVLLMLTAQCTVKMDKEKDTDRKDTLQMDSANYVNACPMKCEGDTVYYKPGKCPVCGMKLEQKKKN